MDVSDYLLDQAGIDWSEILRDWAELLPPAFTLWLVNRFGNIIAVSDDGSIHFFDAGFGTFERIAKDKDDFARLVNVPDNEESWLATGLVDECRALDMQLNAGRCYCFKLPLILGGEWSVENVGTISLREQYSFLADLWRQTRDLPAGTQVRLVVK